MRCPFATWRGSPNENPGELIAQPFGEVWHVEQGTEQGTIQVFSERSWQASSHFGIARVGDLIAVLAAIAHLRAGGSAADLAPIAGIDGFVDVHDKAWAEAAGNPYWISFEDEGVTGEPLTEFQVQAHVLLTLWLRTDPTGPRFAYPLQLTDDPNGRGLGWHGMGGAAWGGHLQCPGEPIKAQRQAVIDALTGPVKSGDEDMPNGIGLSLSQPQQIETFAVNGKGELIHRYFFHGGPVGTAGGGWFRETLATGLRPYSPVLGPVLWPADGFIHVWVDRADDAQVELVWNGKAWVPVTEGV